MRTLIFLVGCFTLAALCERGNAHYTTLGAIGLLSVFTIYAMGGKQCDRG